VTAILAYLIEYENKTLDEALNLVRGVRPIAAPNMGFLAQLMDLDKGLRKERRKSI
jgi:protein-tyrosine phosphatase